MTTPNPTPAQPETLLPCPLYGHLPDKGEFTNGPYIAVSGAPNMPKFYAIVCPGCCSTAYDENKERVVKKWNTRAAVAGPRGDFQRRLYEECVTANWDPEKRNTFAEEIAHLHEELSEAFRAFRRYKDFAIREVNGKLEGVPIEFADALIGMFYNAELHGFDLLEAIELKHQFNLGRNYVAEGRQLHPPAATSSPTPAETRCIHCRHSVDDFNAVTGLCEFDPEPDNESALFCGCKCEFTPPERTRVEGEQGTWYCLDCDSQQPIEGAWMCSDGNVRCAVHRQQFSGEQRAAVAPADNETKYGPSLVAFNLKTGVAYCPYCETEFERQSDGSYLTFHDCKGDR